MFCTTALSFFVQLKAPAENLVGGLQLTFLKLESDETDCNTPTGLSESNRRLDPRKCL